MTRRRHHKLGGLCPDINCSAHPFEIPKKFCIFEPPHGAPTGAGDSFRPVISEALCLLFIQSFTLARCRPQTGPHFTENFIDIQRKYSNKYKTIPRARQGFWRPAQPHKAAHKKGCHMDVWPPGPARCKKGGSNGCLALSIRSQ